MIRIKFFLFPPACQLLSLFYHGKVIAAGRPIPVFPVPEAHWVAIRRLPFEMRSGQPQGVALKGAFLPGWHRVKGKIIFVFI
jgi:hypothetical protein